MLLSGYQQMLSKTVWGCYRVVIKKYYQKTVWECYYLVIKKCYWKTF